MLLRGKGTALIKNLFDLRLVVTTHLILQYVERIFGVCDREQFMVVPLPVARLLRTLFARNLKLTRPSSSKR